MTALYCSTATFGAVGGADDALDCDGEDADNPLCVERARAIDARAKVEAILASLAAVQQPPWRPAELAAASALHDEGVALFRDERFSAATARFGAAFPKLQAIKSSFDDLLADTVAESQAQLAAEDFSAALVGFRRVLTWTPDHEASLASVGRAETGLRLAETAREAIRLVESGEAARAKAVLDGVTADFEPRVLRKARASLRLSTRITAGYAALDRMDWTAATEAFRQALAIDAQSTAARDGLEEARRRSVDSQLASLRQSLATDLGQESWANALATVREIAKLDADAAEVRVRLPELERLVALETRLDDALGDPRRAAAKSLRENTRALIGASGDRLLVGERIFAKGRQLQRQLRRWTVPVAVTIRSDNKTEIHMRPGRKLGRFRSTNLEVYPGRYLLLARRKGFREKQLALTVPPDSDPITLELVCDERF